MGRYSIEQIGKHMSPDRPLKDTVREAWDRGKREEGVAFGSPEEADRAFEEHWAKVQPFLNFLAGSDDVHLV
jgi:hypothetical protein